MFNEEGFSKMGSIWSRGKWQTITREERKRERKRMIFILSNRPFPLIWWWFSRQWFPDVIQNHSTYTHEFIFSLKRRLFSQMDEIQFEWNYLYDYFFDLTTVDFPFKTSDICLLENRKMFRKKIMINIHFQHIEDEN